MIDEESKDNELSKFNMSQLIVIGLNEIFSNADDHFRAGRIDKWFFELKLAKFKFIGKLTDKEKMDLKNKEKAIEKWLVFFAIPVEKNTPLIAKAKRATVQMIEDYYQKLQELIEAKDLGLTAKTDTSRFT